MELTNEERKAIGDAAVKMMQTLCECKLAEDRLEVARSLARRMAGVEVPGEAMEGAVSAYREKFATARAEFFEALGIGAGNEEFWEWYRGVGGEKA